MSVAVALLSFFLGGGLVLLGAFFLWRWSYARRGFWWLVLSGIVPVGVMVLIAAVSGEVETAVGLIWGTVATNLGWVGGVSLLTGWRLGHTLRAVWLWLSLVVIGCCLVSGKGTIGVFGGCALLVVGLIAVWQAIDKKQITVKCDLQEKARRQGSVWRRFCGLVCGVFVVLAGIGLSCWQLVNIPAVFGMPTGLFAVVVMAPLFGVVPLLNLRRQQPLRVMRTLRALLWGSLILVTVGLGLVAIICGEIHLSSSMKLVVLPWVAGMLLVAIASQFLPKKTTRWWGGLIVVLYFVLITNLF
ncbi:MAG: hypothetical protein IJ295_02625 [Clostridia bacterium]|nr:hypothetical protein [Clostridia bacterium]